MNHEKPIDAYLDQQAATEDVTELDEKLRTDPEFAARFVEAALLDAAVERCVRAREGGRLFQGRLAREQVQVDARDAARRRVFRRLALGAAAVLVCGTGVYLIWPRSGSAIVVDSHLPSVAPVVAVQAAAPAAKLGAAPVLGAPVDTPEKMRRVLLNFFLPQINFERVPLDQALATLRSELQHYNHAQRPELAALKMEGADFSAHLGDVPLVTLKQENIPWLTALKIVAAQSGMSVAVSLEAVTLKPVPRQTAADGAMEVASYSFPAELIDLNALNVQNVQQLVWGLPTRDYGMERQVLGSSSDTALDVYVNGRLADSNQVSFTLPTEIRDSNFVVSEVATEATDAQRLYDLEVKTQLAAENALMARNPVDELLQSAIAGAGTTRTDMDWRRLSGWIADSGSNTQPQQAAIYADKIYMETTPGRTFIARTDIENVLAGDALYTIPDQNGTVRWSTAIDSGLVGNGYAIWSDSLATASAGGLQVKRLFEVDRSWKARQMPTPQQRLAQQLSALGCGDIATNDATLDPGQQLVSFSASPDQHAKIQATLDAYAECAEQRKRVVASEIKLVEGPSGFGGEDRILSQADCWALMQEQAKSSGVSVLSYPRILSTNGSNTSVNTGAAESGEGFGINMMWRREGEALRGIGELTSGSNAEGGEQAPTVEVVLREGESAVVNFIDPATGKDCVAILNATVAGAVEK